MSVTNELKVGCLTLSVFALLLVGGLSTLDGLWPGEPFYTVDLVAPNANGLYKGTKVKLAGVEIGAVETIAVEGNRARMKLKLREPYKLPTDSRGELKASGLLGEYFIQVDLGDEPSIIPDGGVLEFGEEPGDIDKVIKQFEGISEDVKAITKELRELAENDDNTKHIEATLANVDALSYELRLLAEQNRRDIDAIVDSVKNLTKTLEDFSVEAASDIDVEMDKLHDATDKLDSALGDVQSITGKIDDGQGTIGALINDDTTIDALNETIENANAVIESFSGLRARVYYTGRLYFGSQPNDPAFFYGNPLAPNLQGGLGYSGSNTIGIQLLPQEDFWWIFEINDYPQGRLTSTQHYFPDQGYAYTEWTREANYRFTFQMEKRWYDFSFRLGVKENGGGLGMTYYTANDRLMLSGDLFDFTFGSYPAIESSGLPNLRLAARWQPNPNLYLETGAEQVLLGAKYGYFTGYLGGGFRFDDDEIKLLLATLPLGF
ncbi:MAG: MCE family protein [Alphaproteobacteria bacterium]|nr:MCE family protein [Alphaproteobacteria bacterium]